jgi:hypothetical protein
LFTEENLILNIVLDLNVGVEHMREPMTEGLKTIQATISDTLQALQDEEAPVAAEPGPTCQAPRRTWWVALQLSVARVGALLWRV